MLKYSQEWHERSLRLVRRWRHESLWSGGCFSVLQGLPRMNVGLYIALCKDADSVRYLGKVRRPGRLNALAMRLEEHHSAGEMLHWGDDLWLIPLREDLFEADVLDAEAMLIDVLDPPENKTHRRGRGRGGCVNRGLDVRASRAAGRH